MAFHEAVGWSVGTDGSPATTPLFAGKAEIVLMRLQTRGAALGLT
jgi:hypothetical protein